MGMVALGYDFTLGNRIAGTLVASRGLISSDTLPFSC
jgi:hypothetical protein